MNGSVSCDTWAYTTRANKPICLSMAQIYGLHMHHRCILCLWRGGSRSRKGCLPAHRWGFHPGLIRARAGGDRWPAERSRDCHRPPPSTPHQSPPPLPDFANILAWVCTIVRHKRRHIWHNKTFFFKKRNYKYSGVALAAPATAPVPAWSEVAIWRWWLIPLLLCAPLSGHHRWLWYV